MNDDRRTRIRTALALIQQASQIIQDVWIEEDVAYENVPENLRGSLRGEQSQTATADLELASNAFETLRGHLEAALNSPT
jgi:hypothetical protein